ncbi:MAG: hypothetical protein HY673_03945 [Chloroflexi bacterium]|nr:hypothetical protein [Chloroflexota bacterium]
MKDDPTHDHTLPRIGYAIMGDPDDPSTWKLPHHRPGAMNRLHRRPRTDIQDTVDWDHIAAAVAALSPAGFRGQRVKASPEDIIAAARHLAAHYRAAGKPLPDTLAALV